MRFPIAAYPHIGVERLVVGRGQPSEPTKLLLGATTHAR